MIFIELIDIRIICKDLDEMGHLIEFRDEREQRTLIGIMKNACIRFLKILMFSFEWSVSIFLNGFSTDEPTDRLELNVLFILIFLAVSCAACAFNNSPARTKRNQIEWKQ